MSDVWGIEGRKAAQVSVVPPTGRTADDLQELATEYDTAIDSASGATSTHAALTTAHGSTALNTASAIVQRDASGNFAAGTITASLTGTASGNDVVGAAAAVQSNLTTHINNATGAHAASAIAVTPSGNLAATTVAAALTEHQGDIDTINSTIASLPVSQGGSGGSTGALASIDGVSNAGGNVDLVEGTGVTITPNDGANTITFAIGQSVATSASPSFSAVTSTVSTGTPPVSAASTTVCPNLNADRVDGFHASNTAAANTIPVPSGTPSSGMIPTVQGDNTISWQSPTGGAGGGVVGNVISADYSFAQNDVRYLYVGACSNQFPAWVNTQYAAVTNQTDSRWDMDAADEADYTQEDAANGTDFIGGVVKLHCTTPNRVILLHGEGSDGSTTIDDDGSNGSGHTWSCQGNAQIDTAQFKWGSSSFLFDGAGDYLRLNATSDMQFTGDFTVSMWIRPSVIVGDVRMIMSCGSSTFEWFVNADGSIQCNIGGSNVCSSSAGIITTGSWQYIQLSRSGTTVKIYVGGTERASGTQSGTTGSAANNWDFGFRSGGSQHPWNGWIDEIMVNNGTALDGTSVPSGAWDSADFPTSQGYYVQTGVMSVLSGVGNIDSLTITQTEPTNTTIRWLYTDNNGTSWKDHNGNVVAIGDIHTSGATAAQMQTKFTNYVPGGSDAQWKLAWGLKTTDATVSPSVSAIAFQWDGVATRRMEISGSDWTVDAIPHATNAMVRVKRVAVSTVTASIQAHPAS